MLFPNRKRFLDVFGVGWSLGHRERVTGNGSDGRMGGLKQVEVWWRFGGGAWRCLGLERATGLWVKTHTIHTWAPWWTNEHEQIPLCVGREPRPRGPVEEVCWLAGLPVVGIFF